MGRNAVTFVEERGEKEVEDGDWRGRGESDISLRAPHCTLCMLRFSFMSFSPCKNFRTTNHCFIAYLLKKKEQEHGHKNASIDGLNNSAKTIPDPAGV